MIIFSVTMEMATFISKIWIKHNKKNKVLKYDLKEINNYLSESKLTILVQVQLSSPLPTQIYIVTYLIIRIYILL